jgi:vacuolar-type H+-ATPase subunit C/Vma6
MMTAIKGNAFGYKNVKDYFIKGGSIPENKLVEIASKDVSLLKNEIPFKIDEAIVRYKKDGQIAHIELAMRTELYKKYLRLFDSLAGSLEAIIAFAIRSEVERDELRAVWLTKYYKISKERAESLRTLKYVVS